MSCARGPNVAIPTEKLFFGIDWARVSDYTWVTITNDQNDVLTWFKYPHLPYEQQIELAMADLKRPWTDGRPLFDRIVGVRGDSTGQGDMPMEFLAMHSGLPVGTDSGVGKKLGFRDEGLGLALALNTRYPNKKVVIYSADTKGERFHDSSKKVDSDQDVQVRRARLGGAHGGSRITAEMRRQSQS